MTVAFFARMVQFLARLFRKAEEKNVAKNIITIKINQTKNKQL
jgi:hypothetical protein